MSVCNMIVKAFVHLLVTDVLRISEQLGTFGAWYCLYKPHFTIAVQSPTPTDTFKIVRNFVSHCVDRWPHVANLN